MSETKTEEVAYEILANIECNGKVTNALVVSVLAFLHGHAARKRRDALEYTEQTEVLHNLIREADTSLPSYEEMVEELESWSNENE